MIGSHTEGRAHVPLPRELKWFIFTSAMLWMLSIAYVGLRMRFARGPHHGLPELVYSPPFFDLLAAIGKLEVVHQPEFFTVDYKWIYPAPCVFVYKFLLQFSYHGRRAMHATVIYFLCALPGLLLLAGGVAGALRRRGLARRASWLFVISTTVLSWPILFALRQANIEGILWIGVAVAVWAYHRGMWWTSAVLIGIFAAFKIYPILLLGLFLEPRKYRQAVASLLIFVAFTLAGLAYIGPTVPIAYHNVANGIHSFTELGFYPAAIDRDYLTFEHSLVSLFRIFTTAHPEYMLVMARYYMPVMALLMTVFFFTAMWKMPRLNQLLVIVIAIVLLPPKSYDYTLQMLYIPWAWLAMVGVSAAARGNKIPGLMPIMVCLALICSPEFFIRFQNFYSFGQFKTVCLLVLLWMAARYPFIDDRAVTASRLVWR